jgi:hypothetical protein
MGSACAAKVHILKTATKDTLFSEIFDFINFSNLEKHGKGIYILPMNMYSGGSGWAGDIYVVKTKPALHLQKISEYGELDTWKMNKSGTALLFFEGIWNSESEEPEGHFGDHRQNVSLITIHEKSVSVKKPGRTKYKYQLIDPPTPISNFLKKRLKYVPK